jgi:hypothetical protein
MPVLELGRLPPSQRRTTTDGSTTVGRSRATLKAAVTPSPWLRHLLRACSLSSRRGYPPRWGKAGGDVDAGRDPFAQLGLAFDDLMNAASAVCVRTVSPLGHRPGLHGSPTVDSAASRPLAVTGLTWACAGRVPSPASELLVAVDRNALCDSQPCWSTRTSPGAHPAVRQPWAWVGRRGLPQLSYWLTLPSSTRTVPSPKLVTKTRPPSGVTATLVGLLPEGIRAVTAPVPASTTAIVPSSTLAV